MEVSRGGRQFSDLIPFEDLSNLLLFQSDLFLLIYLPWCLVRRAVIFAHTEMLAWVQKGQGTFAQISAHPLTSSMTSSKLAHL